MFYDVFNSTSLHRTNCSRFYERVILLVISLHSSTSVHFLGGLRNEACSTRLVTQGKREKERQLGIQSEILFISMNVYSTV
jgi:hypothetical protein